MESVEGQVQKLRWLVATGNVLVKAVVGCFGLVQKAELWKLGGVGVFLVIINKFSPRIFQFILQVLHTR